MPERIPVAQPTLGDEEIAQLTDAIREGRISAGPKVAGFENSIADYVGAKNAIAVGSGTAALHIALAVLGVGPGDEVVVPSMTFISTANVVLYLGATPVLCECDPVTYNVTADSLRRAITPRTKTVIPVEMNGLPIDYDSILPVCEEAGVSVVLDSAESLGSAYRGQLVGSQALVHTLSFFPNKTITTGEGGMLLTVDDEFAAHARRLVNQGQKGRYNHIELGYNYRMTDLQAGVGLAQMGRIQWVLDEKARIAERYDAAFSGQEGVLIPVRPEYATAQSWFMYSVRLNNTAARDAVARALEDEGIETRMGFPPIHTQPYYRDQFNYSPDDFPITVSAYERKLDIPIWAGLSHDQQDRIISVLCRAIPRG
jgi:perosamine synthetase